MSNIVISPESGILEFNYNSPSGAAIGSATAPIRLDATGGNSFITGGNLGVGMTAPTAALHVNGDGGTAARIENGSLKIRYPANNDAITITPSVGNEGRILASDGDTSSPHPLKIGGDYVRITTSGVSAATEVARFTADGKVGIGITDPDAFLDVSRDNSNAGNQFVVADTEGTSAAIRTYTHGGDPAGLILNHYYAEAGGGNEYARYADFVANVGNGAGTKIRFITKNAANNYSATTIDKNGSVGIGSSSPSYKLDVNGTIHGTSGNFETAITINGNPVITGSSASEGDTLQTVTDRGATTTNALTIDTASDISFIVGSTDSTARIQLNDDDTTGYLSINSTSLALGHTTTLGDQTLHLTSAGRVGIGTNNPQTKLTVGSDGDEDGLEVRESGDLIFKVRPSSSHGYLSLYDSSTNEDIRLNSNGDSWIAGGSLGVGMNAPSARLELKGGTSDSSANAFIARNSSSTSLLSVRNDGRVDIPLGPVNIGDTLYLDNNEIWAKNSNNLNVKADGLIRIQPQSYGTAATFATNGNVGIGTTNPATYKLQVAGEIGVGNYMMMKSSATYMGMIGFNRNGNNGAILNNSYGAFQLQNHNGTLNLECYNSGGVIQAEHAFKEDGKVGIGSIAPAYVLDTVFAGDDGVRLRSTDNHSSLYIQSAAGYGGYIRFGDGSNRYWINATSDDKLRFRPNASSLESATINFDATGNVGIGVLSPTEKLEVGTDTDVSAHIGRAHVGYVGHADFAGFSHIDAASTTNYALLSSPAGSTYLNKASSQQIYFRSANADIGGFNASNDFYVDTHTLYVDCSQNNVGVGTSTNHASSKLTIQANNTNDIITGLVINSYQSTTGTAGKGVGIVMGQNNGVYSSKIANVWTNNNPSYLQTNIAFYTMHDSYAAGSETEKMRLTSQGRLGIGTTSPSSPLHVVGTRVRLDGGAGGFYKYTAAEGFRFALYDDGSKTKLYADGDGSNSHMCFDGGKVGIGTDAPDAKLHVEGTMQVKGDSSWAGTDSQAGAIFMDTNGRGLLGAFSTNYARPLIRANSNYIEVGSAGTSLIYGSKIYAGSASSSVGTHNFYTSGTNLRMHIAKDGNVGIGLTDPDTLLEVAGVIKSSSTSRVQADTYNNSANSANIIYRSSSKTIVGNNADALVILDGGNVGIGTTNPVQELQVNGNIYAAGGHFFVDNDKSLTAVGDLRLRTNNGTTAVFIDTSQNVGIGTATPDYTLTVDAGTTNEIARFRSTDNDALISISDNTDTVYIGHDAALDVMSLGFNNSMGVSSNLNIDTDGSVGIGTNNPPHKLSVKGTISRLNSSNIQVINLGVSSEAGQLTINNAGGVTKALIDSNGESYLNGGNVGIGTDNPGATLDLRGDMRLDSGGSTDRSIYFRNQSSQGKVRSDAALQFDVGVSASPTLAMYIQEETKTVGIGTNNPRSGSFHIYNTNSVSDGDGSASMNPTGQDSIVLFTNGSVNNNFGSISWLDGGRRRAMIAAASERADGDYQGLSFFTRGTDGPGDLYESMRINHGGTIGMGVTGAGGFHANAERLVVGDGAGNEGITIYAGTSSAGSLYFADGTAGDAAYRGSIQYSHSAEKLFLGAGGGTQMTLTNTSLVGIGSQSPSKQLTLNAAEPFIRLEESDSGGNKRLDLFVSNSTGVIGANQSAQTMMFQTVGENRMTIRAGGNVGIGTTNPSDKLEVQSDVGNPMMHLRPNAASTALNPIILYRNQLEGSANYMLCQGVSTFFGTYNGGAPTDESEMIRLAPSSSDAPSIRIGDAGSTSSYLQVGGNIKLLNNGTSYINGGDVGIGTTGPAQKLHLEFSNTDTSFAGGGGGSWGSEGLLIENTSATADTMAIIQLRNNDADIHIAGIRQGTDDNDLGFFFEAEEKVRFTHDGAVGIGTTSPQTKLHVTQGTDDNTDGIRLSRANSAASYSQYIDTSARFNIGYSNPSTGDPDPQITLTQGGKVGIGTNSPVVELDVVGTGDFDSVRILNSTQTLNPRLILGRSTSENIQFHVVDNDCTITADQDSDSNGNHKFILDRTFAGAGENDFQIAKDGTAQVTVDTNGSVGIGTNNPSYDLHVEGEILAESNMLLGGDGTYGTTYGAIGIGTTNLTNGHHRIFAKSTDHMYFAASSSKGFRFRPNGGATSATDGITIDSNGRLGIGITNPANKLDVGGGVAIGASYVGTSAPSNGAIIQGNVGIGTTSVSYALQVNGSIVGSYKSFLIDHPTKEGKQLMHSCIEGPEHAVYFRGKSNLNVIKMPDYWEGLVDLDTMTVELTAIGANQNIYVDSIAENGEVTVGSNTDEPLNYFYVVYGERKDIDKLETEIIKPQYAD